MDERRKTGEVVPLEAPPTDESGGPHATSDGPATGAEDRTGGDRLERDRGLSDFVRRAVSAGVGAASRSKDDIMRVAAGEMRSWLEHLDFNNELLKTLSKMVIEVKTEIRFRPTDDGKIVPDTVNDVKVKPSKP
ncbi:MAG TPA: hypothetical protein VH374_11045 [Polyangia bacterium]|jgi:hypothetical protein|nr:hypothetical protein [Polyangia bacterium]